MNSGTKTPQGIRSPVAASYRAPLNITTIAKSILSRQQLIQAMQDQSSGAFPLITADKFVAASSFFSRSKYVRATTFPPSDSDCASCENTARIRVVVLGDICGAHIREGGKRWYLLKCEILRQLCFFEHSFLSPCRS